MPLLTLDTLPPEILYHLCDYLDLFTILYSFRYVCKRFQTIVNSIDRYQLDLRSISKTNFHRLCHYVSPDKISSISLSNDNYTPCQIPVFLSYFSFDQFIHLRSLSLFQINEDNLITILMYLPQNFLRSLTIHIHHSEIHSHTLAVLLSSTITSLNLIRLNLNITCRKVTTISCSTLPLTLKYLHLQHCSFQDYCTILRHTINLQEFTLIECAMYNSNGRIYQPEDRICSMSLISFSFGACFIRLKELFLILSCIPMLKYLKLIHWTDSLDSLIDGNKWEIFLSKNLIYLKQFHFFFDDMTHTEQDSIDIQSFQTPFWLEQHRWFVVCEYIKSLSKITVYSIPIHYNSTLTYYLDSNKISLSTLKLTDRQFDLEHRVTDINLNLNETIEYESEIYDYQLKNSIFTRIQHLSLTLDGRFRFLSIEHLQTIIKLSPIHRLSFLICLPAFIDRTLFTNYLSTLFKQTSNIRALKLTSIPIEESLIEIDSLRTILPETIRHLHISISSFEQIRTIVEQFDHLTSVTFSSSCTWTNVQEIQDYLHSIRKNSMISIGSESSIHIWLGTLIKYEKQKSPIRKFFQRFWH